MGFTCVTWADIALKNKHIFKKSNTRYKNTFKCLIQITWLLVHVTPKIIQIIAAALGSFSEVEGEPLLLKIMHNWDTGPQLLN